MPIEPTNVSKQAVREVEKASANFGSWSSMQGSSTGGKDRPTSNSLWEKAITGAQKLFGSSTPEPQSADESTEAEDSSEKKPGSPPVERPLESVPGFGSRGFGRFSGSAFGGNTFGTVETARISSEPKLESEVGYKTEEPKAKEDAIQQKEESPPKERPELGDGEPEDEGTEAERSVIAIATPKAAKSVPGQAQPATPLPSQANVVQSSIQPESTQPEGTGIAQVASTASQATPAEVATMVPATSAQSEKPIATSNAQTPGAQVPTQQAISPANTNSKVPIVEDAQQKQAPVGPNKAPPLSEAAKQAQETAKPVSIDTTKAASDAMPGPLRDSNSQPVTASPQARSEAAKSSFAGDLANVNSDKTGKPADSLAFDLPKAKDAISDTIARPEKQVAAKPAVSGTVAAQSAQQPAQAPVPTEVANQVQKPLTVDPALSKSAELAEGVNGEAQKREQPALAQQRGATGKVAAEAAAQTRASSSSEAMTAEVKTNQALPVQTNSANLSREAAAAASRIQNPIAANKVNNGISTATTPNALTGVSAGQGVTNANMNMQAAQQGNTQNQQGGDTAAKQEFNAAMKQAANAKGAEKLGGESAQAFEAKVEAAANRRTEAANKASQTSYVSKTAAEVKETIATLTKSIDRLVTDKANAMNLKINFEAGGSVNLRISMEGSIVTT